MGEGLKRAIAADEFGVGRGVNDAHRALSAQPHAVHAIRALEVQPQKGPFSHRDAHVLVERRRAVKRSRQRPQRHVVDMRLCA